MAREIITRILCDVCNDSDELDTAPNGEAVTIEIDGELREIDLCPEHRRPIDGLRAMLEEHGRHVPKRGRGRPRADETPTNSNGRRLHPNEIERMRCPFPGCDFEQTRKAVVSHVRGRHDTTLAELEGKPLDFRCDVDGCDRAFALPQALGLHRQRIHGLTAKKAS